MNALEYWLPRKHVCRNVLPISINTGKHMAWIPGRDFCVQHFDNLVPCLLARDCIITTILLAKSNLNFTNVLVIASDEGDLKPWFEFTRGKFALVFLGSNLLMLGYHKRIIWGCFLRGWLVYYFQHVAIKILLWLDLRTWTHLPCKVFWGARCVCLQEANQSSQEVLCCLQTSCIQTWRLAQVKQVACQDQILTQVYLNSPC